MVAQAVDTCGKLDVLVNNAGIVRDGAIWNMTEADFDAVIRVHVKGTWGPSHCAAKHWRERSKAGETFTGRIINTTSGAGLVGNFGQTNYATAKAAIAGLTQTLSLELYKLGVTVNAIGPAGATRITATMPGAPAVIEPDDVRRGRVEPDGPRRCRRRSSPGWRPTSRSTSPARSSGPWPRTSSGCEGWTDGPTLGNGGKRWDATKLGHAARHRRLRHPRPPACATSAAAERAGPGTPRAATVPSRCGDATSRSPAPRRPTCVTSSTATARGWPPAPGCTSSTAPPRRLVPVARHAGRLAQRGPGARGGLRRRVDVGRGGGPPARRPRPDAHRHLARAWSARRSTASARSAATARTTGRVADVQDLPFRDAAFDVVVANYVLHHVPDAARAVAEMARVVRPDGRVVVACVGDGHLTELHQIRHEVFGDLAADAFGSSFGATAGRRGPARLVRRGALAALPGRPRLPRPRRRASTTSSRPRRSRARARSSADVSSPPCRSASRPAEAACGCSKDTGLFVCRRPRCA